MKNRAFKTTFDKINAGMQEVANTVIKDAEEAGTKILILGKNGKMLKVTPKQMRARLKREENKNNKK